MREELVAQGDRRGGQERVALVRHEPARLDAPVRAGERGAHAGPREQVVTSAACSVASAAANTG